MHAYIYCMRGLVVKGVSTIYCFIELNVYGIQYGWVKNRN